MAKVYFYYSAMNAGKSTMLLQANYNYIERGMQTLMFSPKIDTRAGSAVIYSRIGLKKEAISFGPNFNFYEFVKEKKAEIDNLTCILVDECQFITKEQVMQLTDVAALLNIAVLCYGLRSNFLGEPFEGSKYLLTLAQELVEIKTICGCGRKATMNMRLDEHGKAAVEGETVAIEGNTIYESKCMRCYKDAINESKKELQTT